MVFLRELVELSEAEFDALMRRLERGEGKPERPAFERGAGRLPGYAVARQLAMPTCRAWFSRVSRI